MSLPGIDVSHYNGTIDWKQAASSISFAFAKATQSTAYTDPRFLANWTAMHEAGLARGAYHFLDPAQDGTTQAEHFLNTVQPSPGDLPPVLDIETLMGATAAQAVERMNAWVATVEAAAQVTPLIYCTASFWQQIGNPRNPGDCPLWVAHYGVPAPHIPKAWSSWTFWQSSQTGHCPGITGHVDLDRFAGTVDQLRALCHPSTSEVPPQS